MAVRLLALCVNRQLPAGRFLVLISVSGWVDPRGIVRLEGLGKLKKSNDLIGNRIRDLPPCSIVPQPITILLPRSAKSLQKFYVENTYRRLRFGNISDGKNLFKIQESEVLIGVGMKISVSWRIRRVVRWEWTDFSNKHVASIFRVQE
jgi:hypothetical protein